VIDEELLPLQERVAAAKMNTSRGFSLASSAVNMQHYVWDLVEIRERWARLHLLRTLVSVAALAK
jgi:hypothetical protein